MTETTLIQTLNKDFALQLLQNTTAEELRQSLTKYINQLLITNFEMLVNLLYRIDVSEAKLKTMLQANLNKNAGELIADLIIERQRQKINYRQQFKQDDTIAEEDKW